MSSLQDVYPFFHEFRVIALRKWILASLLGILLLYSPQRLQTRGIGVLLTLAAGEGQWAMFYLMMQACRAGCLAEDAKL
jgi:hypothetical protein